MVLLEETIATRVSDQRIVAARTPRSCSGISQASDITEGFSKEHYAVQHCTSYDFSGLLLHDAFVIIFNKCLEDNSYSDHKADKRTEYIDGLFAIP